MPALCRSAEVYRSHGQLSIGVGIAIAHDPLHGPGRALISASGSYLIPGAPSLQQFSDFVGGFPRKTPS